MPKRPHLPLTRLLATLALPWLLSAPVLAQPTGELRRAPPPPLATPAPGLYEALGGREGIARWMGDAVDRLVADARIAHHFKKTKKDDLARELTEQVCMVSGGPCVLKTRMGPAHEDMKITRADFNALVEDLQDAMDAAGIPFVRQNQLLSLLAPMHREIIELR